MHTLLLRQLRRYKIDVDGLSPESRALIGAIDEAYGASDDDRRTLERSLEISSQESLAINAAIRSTSGLLTAILDSTADGILAVGSDHQVIHSNARFAELWRIPDELLDQRNDKALLNFVVDQVSDPAAFVAKIEDLYRSTATSLDSIEFKDGRIVERYSRPLLDGDGIAGRVWSFRDVTETRRALLALQEREERFRALVLHSSDMIIILDASGVPTYASPSFERIMGLTLQEWLRDGVFSIVHPDDLELSAVSLKAVLSTGGVHPPSVVRFRHGDGSWRDVEVVANNMLDVPAVAGVVYNARDVTDQLRAERATRQSEARFRSLVQNSTDVISVLDENDRVSYLSPSALPVLGYSVEDSMGGHWRQFLHPDDAAPFVSFLTELGRSRDTAASIEVRARHQDGTWRTMDVIGRDLRGDPAVAGVVLNARDVTERKALEEQVRHQAFHDPLTNLANRVLFADRLEHALERALRTHDPVAVLFVDVDNFKSVNDAFGHSVGDTLLAGIAGRIHDVLRPGDTAARFGGDEFTLLLEGLNADEAIAVGERVVGALRAPFEIAGRDVFVEVSIGVAMGMTEEATVDGLLRDSDAAMYAAKSRGKARVELYDKHMHVSTHDRMRLLADLQRAIELEQFVLQYQPTFELASGRMVGAEALVRWNHPERGMIPPLEFIPLAEEGGVIHALGAWVLREACAQLRRWQVHYPQSPPLHMSVNVSGHQLQPGFVDEVSSVIAESGIAPSTLVIEVTESVMMRDVPSTVALLNQLKALGVRLAIDDFGTGYSSLSYLRQFPFDILKIDKSFVDDDGDDKKHELTAAIVEIGRTLQLELVAEGIERADQLDRLLSLQCDIGQGFFFAKPMFADDMEALLNRNSAESSAA